MGKPTADVLPFPLVSECSSDDREEETIISDLDGTLLRSKSSFPYYFLVAFEASGILRSILLLLAAPLAYILHHFVSEVASIKLLTFVTFAGLKVKKIESVSRAVLPRFYSQDLHPESWRVFSSFGKKYVLTANPRIMVENFAKELLGVDEVIASEIEVTKGGRATGFLKGPGVLVGANREKALLSKLGSSRPEVGLGDQEADYSFMSLCKEGYIVPEGAVNAVPREKLPKPIVFHDGRLVCRPTPFNALITLIWMPIGFVLALLRISMSAILPARLWYNAIVSLGVQVIVKGTPPAAVTEKGGKLGVLFVSSHRTCLDPVMLCVALRRHVSTVSYSVSAVSEFISPIKIVAITRNKESDAATIRKTLEQGDLSIFPEGTTGREPFLLRFSALFAELTNQIVPVAMYTRMSMFHGTTAIGWKGMDAFFFLMNPRPVYEVNFLDQLPLELSCSGGKTSYEVANYIQRLLATALNFECTNFTRKDKYSVLAGNDGTVAPKKEKSAEQKSS